eukprot:CAMPEP_0182477214 /NCGR_PEP_ID=MMETSP1319-20130603/30526_1 /TAXON_ID=172717 /ORGANISM="Bolidomonas pacifica, Strain RCC208" /LENGTH=382 /DNA_ID=CAMNT_0024678401 /DNA_START=170 /DNA_END=1316 /DNA_ORIENTATION=-
MSGKTSGLSDLGSDTRQQLTALLPAEADPQTVDDIIAGGPYATEMYLSQLGVLQGKARQGYYVASTQMSFDPNDRYYAMYSVGFTSLNRPEIIIKNVHKTFMTNVLAVFQRIYDIIKAGTDFSAGHGISSNLVKYCVARPSESELRQLQKEFLGQACTLYGAVPCYELLVTNALIGLCQSDPQPQSIPNCTVPVRIEPLRCCALCARLSSTAPAFTKTKLMKCSSCKEVSYCSKACQKKDWKRAHKAICEASAARLQQQLAAVDSGLFPNKEETEDLVGITMDATFSSLPLVSYLRVVLYNTTHQVYMSTGGRVPRGCVAGFKDGDKMNMSDDNVQFVPMGEALKRPSSEAFVWGAAEAIGPDEEAFIEEHREQFAAIFADN